jgi:hypothetical protein
MKFRENPSNAIRDTGEKVLCSSSKVPLITHRLQPILTAFAAYVCKVPGMNFQENPSNGG